MITQHSSKKSKREKFPVELLQKGKGHTKQDTNPTDTIVEARVFLLIKYFGK
jgi:hypothetical protein